MLQPEYMYALHAKTDHTTEPKQNRPSQLSSSSRNVLVDDRIMRTAALYTDELSEEDGGAIVLGESFQNREK